MNLSDLKNQVEQELDNYKFHIIRVYLNYNDYSSILKENRPNLSEVYFLEKDRYLQIGFSVKYCSVIVMYGAENIENDHCRIVNAINHELYVKVLTENERMIKSIIE